MHKRRNRLFDTASEDALLQTCYQQVLARHQHQGQKSSKDESKYHGPGKRAPENDVVSTKVNVRIQLSEHSDEVDIKSDGKRYKAQGRSQSCKQHRCHTRLSCL